MQAHAIDSQRQMNLICASQFEAAGMRNMTELEQWSMRRMLGIQDVNAIDRRGDKETSAYESWASSQRRGFTIIELLTSIAVCAVLVSILIPALAGAREQARRGKCLANLRSISTTVAFYLDENAKLPAMDDLPEDVQDLRCPSARLPDEGGYPYPVTFGMGMGGTPATTFFGRTQSQNPAAVSVVSCWRHEPKPAGFLDGHAR